MKHFVENSMLGLCALCVWVAGLGAAAQAQNVGIGTASPLQRLHVAGSLRTDGALVMQPPATLPPAPALVLGTPASTVVIGSNAPTTGDANALSVSFAPAEGQVLYIVNTDNDTGIFVPTGALLPPGATVGALYLAGAWRPLGGGGGASGWALTGNSGTDPATNYLGTTDAQDFVIRTDATERMRFSGAGRIDLTGDLINQDIVASYIPCSTAVASPAPTLLQSAASLGIPTDVAGVTTRSNSQFLVPTTNSAEGCVVHGLTQSITIEDGSGIENSGVVVLGNVSIRTLNNGALPNTLRICLWLQRSTDGFVSDIQNVYRVESAVTTGHPVSGNLPASGNTAVPLVYADLGLAPGTYTYRVVFQGNNYGTGMGSVNFEALDRSLVLLQIKR